MKKMLVLCLAMVMLFGVSSLVSAETAKTLDVVVNVAEYAELLINDTHLEVTLNKPGDNAFEWVPFTVNANHDVLISVDTWTPVLTHTETGNQVVQDTANWAGALKWSVQLFNENEGVNGVDYQEYLAAIRANKGSSNWTVRLHGQWDDREFVEDWWNVAAGEYTANVNLTVAAR